MNFEALARKAGVIFDTGEHAQILTPQARAQIAMDAQSVAITAPSAGVPSLFNLC